MPDAVTVIGEDNIARGLERVSRGLETLAPARAGQIMLKAAQERAPVRTGRLRASGRAGAGTVEFTAPYAGPVHWGWRARGIPATLFALRGVEASKDQWEKVYRDDVQDDLDRIRGA